MAARGELGNGTTATGLTPTPVPVAVVGVTDATAVAVGDFSTCAIVHHGAVSCGVTDDGRSARQRHRSRIPTSPSTSFGITDATTITVGAVHASALHATGTVSCWGYGGDARQWQHRRLGGAGRRERARRRGRRRGWTATQACTLILDGTVECWGLAYPNYPTADPRAIGSTRRDP